MLLWETGRERVPFSLIPTLNTFTIKLHLSEDFITKSHNTLCNTTQSVPLSKESKTTSQIALNSCLFCSFLPPISFIPSAEALEEPFSAGVVAGAVIGSLLALLLVVTLVGILLSRSQQQQRHGYPSSGDSIATGRDGSNGGDYSNKARLLFSGAGKNGTGTNNNGPIYTYRGGCNATGTLMGKTSDYHCRHLPDPPATHDILLSCELGDPERKKFDMDESTEEEEERYDHFEGGSKNIIPPTYCVLRGHSVGEEKMDAYLDDDMESQKDGSVISRTAIYVWGQSW